MIGSFVGRRLSLDFVKETVTRVWKLNKGFTMKPFGQRMFSFESDTMEDKQKFLDMGIASNLFVIRPWQLFVEAEIEEMKTIPIWVIIKRLPIELWDEDGFSVVRSAAIRKKLSVQHMQGFVFK